MAVRHGAASTYNRGCRCEVCRKANSKRNRAMRAKRSQQASDSVPHGWGGYTNYGCRCEVCKAAQSEKNRQQRLSELDPNKHGRAANVRRGCKCSECSRRATEISLKFSALRQARSLETARNHGKQWTGLEMETLLRDDLSAAKAARLLGRSYWAVQTMRRKIRQGDPVSVFLAGERELPEPRRAVPRRRADSEPA